MHQKKKIVISLIKKYTELGLDSLKVCEGSVNVSAVAVSACESGVVEESNREVPSVAWRSTTTLKGVRPVENTLEAQGGDTEGDGGASTVRPS